MKYFSFSDFAYALMCSSTLGLIMGGIYNSLSTIIASICKLLWVGIDALISPTISRPRAITESPVGRNAMANVYDFVFFLTFGAAHILLCYITMDGVQRIYIIIPSIITFIVSKNTLGALFEKIFIGIYTPVYRILFTLLYLLTYPLKLLYRGMKILLLPLFKRIALFIEKTRINTLLRKKKRQLRIFFNSATKI
jgi:hypothetical protein